MPSVLRFIFSRLPYFPCRARNAQVVPPACRTCCLLGARDADLPTITYVSPKYQGAPTGEADRRDEVRPFWVEGEVRFSIDVALPQRCILIVMARSRVMSRVITALHRLIAMDAWMTVCHASLIPRYGSPTDCDGGVQMSDVER